MVDIDLALHLFDAANEECWSDILFSLAARLGYKYVLYSISLDKEHFLEESFSKNNYLKNWKDTCTCIDDQLHRTDPIISHCMRSSLPLIWGKQSFKNNAFNIHASSYGLHCGISYPVHGAKGEFGILSMFKDDPKTKVSSPNEGPLLASMALFRDYVFESSKKFVYAQHQKTTSIKLTRCELECLSWVMKGKSSWEISRISSRAVGTINFHIGNVKKKFHVRTRQQAIVQAIKYGFLAPE